MKILLSACVTLGLLAALPVAAQTPPSAQQLLQQQNQTAQTETNSFIRNMNSQQLGQIQQQQREQQLFSSQPPLFQQVPAPPPVYRPAPATP